MGREDELGLGPNELEMPIKPSGDVEEPVGYLSLEFKSCVRVGDAKLEFVDI